MRLLYHYPLCGASRVVRFMLAEKKLDFSLQYETTWGVSDKVYEVNVFGTLPVFVDMSGTSVYGSSAIREYLESVYPEVNLLGGDYFEMTEARKIADWFDFVFAKDVYSNVVNEKIIKRFSRSSEPANPNNIRLASSKLGLHMEYLSWLIDRRNWLSGQLFSVADIYAASFLSVLDYLDFVPWKKYEVVKDWYARIKSRPAFRAILSDNLAQIPASKEYSNPDF